MNNWKRKTCTNPCSSDHHAWSSILPCHANNQLGEGGFRHVLLLHQQTLTK